MTNHSNQSQNALSRTTSIILAEVTYCPDDKMDEMKFGFYFKGTAHERFEFPWMTSHDRQEYLRKATAKISYNSLIMKTDALFLAKLYALTFWVGEDDPDSYMYDEMIDALLELYCVDRSDRYDLLDEVEPLYHTSGPRPA